VGRGRPSLIEIIKRNCKDLPFVYPQSPLSKKYNNQQSLQFDLSDIPIGEMNNSTKIAHQSNKGTEEDVQFVFILQSSFHQKEDYFLFEKRHAKLDQKPTE
jgi:hypothetical protein